MGLVSGFGGQCRFDPGEGVVGSVAITAVGNVSVFTFASGRRMKAVGTGKGTRCLQHHQLFVLTVFDRVMRTCV